MKLPRINITQKFIVYLVVISILPLFIVRGDVIRISDGILQETFSNYSSTVVTGQRDYLELQLEQVENLIANVSGVEEISDALKEGDTGEGTFTDLVTQARIGYILNGYSNVRGLVSIDIFGVNSAYQVDDDINYYYVGTTHYHFGDTLSVSNIRDDVLATIYARTAASDQIMLWNGVEENVNGNSAYGQVLTASKMLTELNMETLETEPTALLLVNIRLEDIYNHLSQVDLGEDAYMMVIDGQDRIIYHPDWNYVGKDLVEIDADISDLLTDDVGELTTMIREEKIFLSYARLEQNDMMIMGLIPIETLTAKTAVIRRNTMITLLLSFVVIGFFAWLYNRDVVQPIQEITHRFQMSQNGSSDWDAHITPHGNDEISELVEWFNTFMDTLAERSRAEAQIEASLREKEVLLQEIHHRVKNNLQIISSLLNLQAGRSTDPKLTAVFQDSQNRIRSMALIHEKLYQSKNLAQVDLGEYIHVLVTYLIRSYRATSGVVDVEIKTDEVYIDVGTAVPCGLLLNELISNALKYAFVNGRRGKITITLSAEDNQITLVVGDNGIGISDEQLANRRNTLGLRLVHTLVRQIDADMNIKTEAGTEFEIKFELPSQARITDTKLEASKSLGA